MAEVAKALGDPIRLQLVDVLRKHAGKVCVCELVPLFDISQPTLSHHLKKLRDAGIVDSERRGLWAYYYVLPRRAGGADRMAELTDPCRRIRVARRRRRSVLRAGEKAACCETSAAGGSCGCAAGELRETVRPATRGRARHHDPTVAAGCCGPDAAVITDEQAELFGASLYADSEQDELPDTALQASLGCGNPLAMVDLHDGDVVLDLGSGGGIDVLLSARRVAPDRHRVRARHDRRDARARAREPGQGRDRERALAQGADRGDPAARRVGRRRALQLRDQPLDRQAARAARGGARAQARRALRVSDVIADPDMDEATRADIAQYVGCVAGALTHDEYTRYLADAGLTEIEIVETHRVHESAGSAIIRARKPA